MTAARSPRDYACMRRDGCYLVDDAGNRFLDLRAGTPREGGASGAADRTGRATDRVTGRATDRVTGRATDRVTGRVEDRATERVTESAARWAAELAAAIEREGTANDLRCVVRCDGGTLTIGFSGQENASPELMLGAYEGELRAAGIAADPPTAEALDATATASPPTAVLALHLPPEMDDAARGLAESALRRSIRRMRTLLVEHNSYLSGGLRYPFPPSAPGVAERGLAIYRFPRLGDVDVTAIDDRIRIAFAAGHLGPVTSCGFYVPTLIGGDFVVEAEYTIVDWQPDSVEPACFALFAQNEDSSHRYYAQRMSAGTGPHRLVASSSDVLSPETGVAGADGALRVSRRGPEIVCHHRQDGDWQELGRGPAPREDEMVVGSKIWAKLRCGGLTVDVYNLRIDGRMADRQVPPVPVVEDPRSNPPACP